MSQEGKVLLIVFSVGLYFTFLGTIIFLAMRWSMRKMAAKTKALDESLRAAGGRPIGEPRTAFGPSGGNAHEFEIDGKRVVASTGYGGKSYTRVSLKVTGGPYPAVVVFPEGKVERLGKHLGLNHEVQTGDKVFDDAAYVDTIETNDEYVQRLLGSADVRDQVRALLGYGFRVQFGPAGIEAFRLTPNSKPIDVSNTGQAAGALSVVAQHAPAFKTETLVKPGTTRHVALTAGAIVTCVIGAMFAGGVSAITARTLDASNSAFAYLILGGFVWALVVIGAGAWVKGTSSALTTLLVVGFAGLIGIPATVGSLALGLNQWLDDSKGDVHATTVRKRMRNKSEYSIRVDPWSSEDADFEKVYTSYARWQTLKVGDRVEVREHPGAFGWRWAEKLDSL